MTSKEKVRIFMERFKGRPDVYGRQWVKSTPDGKEYKGFVPVCDNIWTDVCAFKTKSNVQCSDCKHKKYRAIDETAVKRHISGDQNLLIYLLQEDNTTWFAAMDFDCKPNKRESGYYWEDVKKVSELCDEWGLPHGIARSTTEGFHVYLFFDEPVKAAKVMSLINGIYQRVGFTLDMAQGGRTLPEIFPKQGSANGGLGNGIKPPMIETRFVMERNCFVDKKNQMIPEEFQWQHLDKIERVTLEQVQKIMDEQELPEYEHDIVGGGGGGSYNRTGSNGKWQPPMQGSIEKVLNGCKAFRGIRDRVIAGEVLGHQEGFALYHMCMHTQDGLKWFETHVKGWGETPAQMAQLEQSKGKHYKPWTCRKLQSEGVCIPGTKCLEKKPVREKVNGVEIIKDDLPKDQWPDPSPFRYALGPGDDFLLKLQKEVDDLVDEEDVGKRDAILTQIIKRAQVFDDGQQKSLKEHITSIKVKNKKLFPKRDVNKRFKEAQTEAVEQQRETAGQRDDIVIVNDDTYQKLQPRGYAVAKMKGNAMKISPICDFDLVIEEVKIYVDSGQQDVVQYHCKIITEIGEKEFEMDNDTFTDKRKFYTYLCHVAGGSFNVLPADMDHVRNAAIAFSRKQGVERSITHAVQGWDGDTYLMPSVMINKDGIVYNDQKPVDLAGKEFASSLDFDLPDTADLKATLLHIKTDLFKAFHERAAYAGIAHTMLAGIIRKINNKTRPTLWVEGLTGTGKSTLCELLQAFWGDFDQFINWTSTAKSILTYGFDFKDACLYVDDFKPERARIRSAKEVVQYAYDGGIRGALQRSGAHRASKSSRCLYMASAEDTPTNEASLVARMLLVEYPRKDNFQTKDVLERCKDRMHEYKGVTPFFIHHFLQQDISAVKARLKELQILLQDEVRGAQNADRVCLNVAMNLLAFNMFVDFMYAQQVVLADEATEMKQKHYSYCCEIRDAMIQRCSDEQNGLVFLQVLKESLLTGRAAIKNLPGYNPERGTVVGTVKDGEKSPKYIYLYPSTVVSFVKNEMRNDPLEGSPRSLATQLRDLGYIETEDNRNSAGKPVRLEGKTQRVWVMPIEKLIPKRNLKSVPNNQQGSMIKNVPTDQEGLI